MYCSALTLLFCYSEFKPTAECYDISDMSTTFIATIAGLVAAFGWGTSDFLSARATRKLRPIQVSLAAEAVALCITCVLLTTAGLYIHTVEQAVRIVLYSICLNTAYFIFLNALSIGAVGIVVPISNAYPFFTLLLALVFQQVHFNMAEIGAMIAIVAGGVVLAYEKNHKKVPLQELHKKTLLATLSAVIWGLGFFILNPVANQLHWQSIAIVSEVFSVFLIGGFFLATTEHGMIRTSIKQVLNTKVVFACAAAGQLGMLSFYFSSSKASSVVIPTVLGACGTLVASLWGRLFDHERIGSIKRIGALVIVAGIIILNLA